MEPKQQKVQEETKQERNFQDGYPDSILMDPDENLEEFRCAICLQIFNIPVSDPDGCVFCKPCISKVSKCPKTQKEYPKGFDFPIVRLVKTIIEKKRCFCYNNSKGCKQEGTIEKLNDHAKTCDYEIIFCKNEGCKNSSEKRATIKHLLECPFRWESCKHNANHQMIVTKLDEHQKTCPDMLIECEQKCGKSIPRKSVDEHLNQFCWNSNVLCEQEGIGCKTKILRKDLDDHYNNPKNIVYHMKLMMIDRNSLKKENELLKQEIGITKIYLRNKLSSLFQMDIPDKEKQRFSYNSFENIEKVKNSLIISTIPLAQEKKLKFSVQWPNQSNFACGVGLLHVILNNKFSWEMNDANHGTFLIAENKKIFIHKNMELNNKQIDFIAFKKPLAIFSLIYNYQERQLVIEHEEDGVTLSFGEDIEINDLYPAVFFNGDPIKIEFMPI